MQKFLNKRVEVSTTNRDPYGRKSSELIKICGLCTYIGENKLLGYPLEIIVDRMPIQLNNINQVKLL